MHAMLGGQLARFGLLQQLQDDLGLEGGGVRLFHLPILPNPGPRTVQILGSIIFRGEMIKPKTGYWKTGQIGMTRLVKANRLVKAGTILKYRRFLNDFSGVPIANYWDDASSGASRSDPKIY